MPDVKISGLPAASGANATDQLEANQAGTSRRITPAQLLDYIVANSAAGGDLSGPLSNLQIGPGAVGTNELADDAVTWAKLQNMATARLLGRNSAGSGDVEALDAATARGLLGLGTAAQQPSTAFQPSAGVYNVENYRLSGYTDQQAIEAAIAASTAGSTVVFPLALYTVSGDIQYPGNRAYIGFNVGVLGTEIRLANGANPTYGVFVSQAYATNATTSGNPVAFRDLTINGNKANNTTGNGIVLMNYRSEVRGCDIRNVAVDGIVIIDRNAAGTAISNTLIECRIQDNLIDYPGRHGIFVTDYASGASTDGYCLNNIVAHPGEVGIVIRRAAGWWVCNNHTYASGNGNASATSTTAGGGGIELNACWNTFVIGNEVDGFGHLTSAQTSIGINLEGVLAGRPTLLLDNIVNAAESNWTNSTFVYYRVRNASPGITTTVRIHGNAAHQDSSGGVVSNWISLQPNSGTMNAHMGHNTITGPNATPSIGTGTVNQYGVGASYAKGALLVAAGAYQLQPLAVGANDQVLTADSAQALGVRWAALAAFSAASVAPGGANDIYDDYGNRSAGIIETMGRDSVSDSGSSPAPTTGTLTLTYFTPDQTVTISNLTSATRSTAKTGGTLGRMGLFSVDGSGNLTCIARTASDTTMWNAANTVYTRAIADDGASTPNAISSVNLTRGQRYAFAVLHVGATAAPTYVGKAAIAGLVSLTPRRMGYLSAQTDIPASITAATINGNTATGNYIYGRMS